MTTNKAKKYEEIKDLLLNASPEYVRGDSFIYLTRAEIYLIIKKIEEICEMSE